MTRLELLESDIGSRLKDAEAFLKRGRAREAMELCSAVIERFPDVSRAYEIRSSTFRKVGDLDRAIEDIGHVVRLNPVNAAPLFRRSRYLMQKADYERAIDDLSRAISLDTGYFGDTLKFYRAEAYLRCRRYAQAVEDCRAIAPGHEERHFFGHSRRTRADIEAEAKANMAR